MILLVSISCAAKQLPALALITEPLESTPQFFSCHTLKITLFKEIVHVARKTNADSTKLLSKVLLYLQPNNEQQPHCCADLNPEDFLLSGNTLRCAFFSKLFCSKTSTYGFLYADFIQLLRMEYSAVLWHFKLFTLAHSEGGLMSMPGPIICTQGKLRNEIPWEIRFNKDYFQPGVYT